MDQYWDLAEKIFVSYIRDLLRPHNIHNPFSNGVYRHKSNGGRVYYHPRNQINKIDAKRFFSPRSEDLQYWCDALGIDKGEILKIVNHCVTHNHDRLYGKKAMRAYFKKQRNSNDRCNV